jgi:photosystem II stability/assembly factor-like uncharacterized protein
MRAQWTHIDLPYTFLTAGVFMDSVLVVDVQEHLFLSRDFGKNWNPAGYIPLSYEPERLTIFNSDLILTTQRGGIFRSKDTGKTWLTCDDSGLDATGAAAIIAVGDTLITNTGYNGIFFSSNEGHSWMPIERFYFDSAIQQFSLNGKYLFAAAAKGGVFRSSDGGIGWERLTPWMGDTEVNTIATRGSVVVAGTRESGIYRSTDYGEYWESVNNGFTQMDVRALIFAGDTIFAGFNHGAGIYLSIDSGLTWHDASQGLTDKSVYVFCVGGGYLFAGGGGNSSLWRRPLSNFDAVKRVGAPSELTLAQNTPNPFKTNTTFNFTLEKSSKISLIVTDVLGKEVYILDHKIMSAGDHNIDWNAYDFANGIYSYRLEANGISMTKKLVVVK